MCVDIIYTSIYVKKVFAVYAMKSLQYMYICICISCLKIYDIMIVRISLTIYNILSYDIAGFHIIYMIEYDIL